MTPKSDILVPLYIYPAPGAWDPLHKVIQACPSVTFTIVVNPFNGPGPTPTPDACYTSEIPRLSVYPNVRLLGYVHTTYTTRSLDLVLRDVETYADWRRSSNIPGLEVAGIFVDETPWKHDEKAVQYLAELNRSVKESVGGFGSNGGIVVHNPGCVPHKAFLGLADTTVVFEDAYATFQQRQEAKLLDKVGDRSKLACLMHSVPEKMDGIEWRRMMREVRNVAGMVFITDLASGYYSNFGNCWERFANGMAEVGDIQISAEERDLESRRPTQEGPSRRCTDFCVVQ